MNYYCILVIVSGALFRCQAQESGRRQAEERLREREERSFKPGILTRPHLTFILHVLWYIVQISDKVSTDRCSKLSRSRTRCSARSWACTRAPWTPTWRKRESTA